jgi:hypothetical protein
LEALLLLLLLWLKLLLLLLLPVWSGDTCGEALLIAVEGAGEGRRRRQGRRRKRLEQGKKGG